MLSVRDLADGAAVLSGLPDQAPLALVDLSTLSAATPRDLEQAVARSQDRQVVVVGIGTGPLPDKSLPLIESLTCTLAPSGPGRAWVAADDGALERITRTVTTSPYAALTLVNLLPTTARCSVPDGLLLESLAYSTLLAGPEFSAWRASRSPRDVPDVPDPVLVDRHGDTLTIRLNRPERRNAFGRAVRDGLIEALEIPRLDPTVASVVLEGAGPCFSSGGDLDEFGTAADPAAAHLTRLGRSAGLAVHRLRDLVRPRLHGACVGAGVEVPSFAGQVTAHEDAWFMLPELAMGLIPGAGGTVSLTRRIGAHRTAFMALTGDRIGARTALDWGLVDALCR